MKDIPSDKLEAILSETLIRRSILENENQTTRKGGMVTDSIDYHSDILARYGYTYEDFTHTIKAMARRKSNPLDGILENVSNKIEDMAAVAEYRYNIAKNFDKEALDFYRDTLLIIDTLNPGNLNKLDSIKICDTVLLAGDYEIKVRYKTMADYRYPTKSMHYYFADTVDVPTDKKTIWLSRSASFKEVTNDYKVESGTRDSLIIYFVETRPSYVKKEVADKLDKDTSYIDYVTVVYTPLVEEARERYFRRFYGEDYAPFREYELPELPYTLVYDIPFEIDTIFPPLDSLTLDSLRLDSIRLDSIRFDSLRLDSLRLDSIRLDSIKLDTLNLKYEK